MNDCITSTCNKCNETKPITEFYTRPDGSLYNHCKKCHIKTTALYPVSEHESPEHETRCVQWLRSCGIPSIHGKAISGDEFAFVDIVAFGCIRVEVKLIQLDGRVHFTHRQRMSPCSDIIIIERFNREYHVFLSNHYQFYKAGQLQRVVRADTIDFAGSFNRLDIIEHELMRQRLLLVDSLKQPIPIQSAMFE